MSKAEKNGDDEEALLRERLAKLNEALRQREMARDAGDAPGAAPRKASMGRALSAGLNAFSEFVAGVLVGAGIGWLADAWLGTKPWLLVLFLGLGTAAGFWNVIRLARGQSAAGEEK
jgi:ATP synthase protein I